MVTMVTMILSLALLAMVVRGELELARQRDVRRWQRRIARHLGRV